MKTKTLLALTALLLGPLTSLHVSAARVDSSGVAEPEGEPRQYRGEALSKIAMPVGGITAGERLKWWEPKSVNMWD